MKRVEKEINAYAIIDGEEYFNVDVDHVIYGEENVNFKLPKELRK